MSTVNQSAGTRRFAGAAAELIDPGRSQSHSQQLWASRASTVTGPEEHRYQHELNVEEGIKYHSVCNEVFVVTALKTIKALEIQW